MIEQRTSIWIQVPLCQKLVSNYRLPSEVGQNHNLVEHLAVAKRNPKILITHKGGRTVDVVARSHHQNVATPLRTDFNRIDTPFQSPNELACCDGLLLKRDRQMHSVKVFS